MFSRPSRIPDQESTQKPPKPVLQNDPIPEQEALSTRRVSIPNNKTTPKKKAECGTHVVAKSELWDTGTQHRCMKSHQKSSRVSITQEEGRLSEFISTYNFSKLFRLIFKFEELERICMAGEIIDLLQMQSKNGSCSMIS